MPSLEDSCVTRKMWNMSKMIINGALKCDWFLHCLYTQYEDHFVQLPFIISTSEDDTLYDDTHTQKSWTDNFWIVLFPVVLINYILLFQVLCSYNRIACTHLRRKFVCNLRTLIHPCMSTYSLKKAFEPLIITSVR
jgi:hypothetical protein